jgi:hypothetical protein
MRRFTAPKDQKSGTLTSTPIDSDRVTEQETVSCRHCGRVWLWRPGSGIKRGWCMRCNGFTCGNDACDTCLPMMQMIENMEAGMSPEEARRHRPIRVAVTCAPPKAKPQAAEKKLVLASDWTQGAA